MLQLHKRINFPCCYQRVVFIKACGILLYLRWNIMIRIMWFVVSSSYCLKLWLHFPQPDCPTKSVHTRITLHHAPTGISVPVLFFFFPPLLLSHLTHKQHKSRRGCVFTAMQFLQHQG